MKGVQCYELFGGIALKIYAFYFFYFSHVSIIARTCYFKMIRLAFIRSFLTSTATATIVSTLVLS